MDLKIPTNKQQTPWPESASELYRPSDSCLAAKLVPTFADRGCHVASVTVPCGCNLGFLDRSRYLFFQVAPQLYSRGRVDSVPDPLSLSLSLSLSPWPESASELYRPSYRRLSAKLVPTFADRGCHVVRVRDPYGRMFETHYGKVAIDGPLKQIDP
jgi:hypothetical protein